MSRRVALGLAGAGVTAFYFRNSRLFRPRVSSISTSDPLSLLSPICRQIGDKAPRVFTGDTNPQKAHQVLWDIPGFLASRHQTIPEPSERVPLVVVGGGLSGLFSSYLLREHQPIVLEFSERFGGNAKGESWEGIDYSIGSAYYSEPSAESEMGKLFHELELHTKIRKGEKEEPVLLRGQWHDRFWEDGTNAHNRNQFQKISRYFKNVLHDAEGLTYPEIPFVGKTVSAVVKKLDAVDLHTHLKSVLGGALDPDLEAGLEHYCYAAFATSMRELSAAAGLNFLAAEFGPINALAGGNAAVAERLLERLLKAVPVTNVRNQALVLQIKVEEDGVRVSYENAAGEIRTILAKAVVAACPKFIVGKILVGPEKERLDAFSDVEYRAYLVCNVLLNARPKRNFFDMFVISEEKNAEPFSEIPNAMDVVLGTFAVPHPNKTVLTLYRPISIGNGRSYIYPPEAYENFRKDFENQIQKLLLPALGFSPSQIVDIRLTRWGHAIPVPKVGRISGDTCEWLRKPFRERVFFVEQDNWCLPALETTVLESLHWAPKVDALLRAL